MKSFNHSPLLRKIEANAQKFPDKIAVISGSDEVAYADLVQSIIHAANFLKSKGLKKGDYIAISAQKDLGFISIYFAAHSLGIINIVVDAESNPQKLEYILNLMQPKLTFGFACKQCESLQYEDIDLPKNCVEIPNDCEISENDVADIIFTTGTTGLPKGVQLSHFNIFSSADNINGFICNTQEDVEVLGLPLCHSFGLGRLRCTLIMGATMVLVGNFANLKVFFNAIETYHATGFGMVPAVWAYIRKFSGTRISKYANQIKYIEIGSAAMPIASKQELCELFPNTRICMHYGLTEASRSAFMEFHENINQLNTIGKAVCGKVEIKIFNEDGTEALVNETGEICVKGNMVMKGYYLAKDNEDAYFGDFFRTGDCGYYDEKGYLFLESRKKEIINTGGKKVSPVEIEDAICVLGVEDCICIGVPDPDGIMGEVAKVYVKRDGCKISFDEIKKSMEGKLEPYKIPAIFEWIDVIPKTSSGKKQRLSLKK